MLRTIRLYGRLGQLFGRSHRLAVATPAEAVRALCAMRPGFEKYLMEAKDHGFGFAVFCGKRNLAEHELLNDTIDGDIRIAPMVFGAKSGWVQIIVGVVLIIVGVIIAAGTWGLAGPIGAAFISAGIGMIIGGIMQLLAPHPKGQAPSDKADETPSYAFNGPINTMAQGYPVPLLYGRMRTGSAVVSAGIFVQDNFVAPVTTPGVGSGGAGGLGNLVAASFFGN